MNIKILTPCERVLRDANSGPSLIATFQEMKIGVLEGQEVPSNAVIPRDWAVFALWHISKDDVLPMYQQWTEILWPDGSPFLKQSIDIKIEQPDWVMNIIQMQGFPMGQPGKLTVRVWIEANAKPASEIVETWINVKHETVTAPVEKS